MNERGASADAPFGPAQTQTGLTAFDGFPMETTDEARAAQAAAAEEIPHRFDTSSAAAPATVSPIGRRAQRAAGPTGPDADAERQAWRPRDFRPRDGASDPRGQSFSVTDAADGASDDSSVPQQEFMPSEAPSQASQEATSAAVQPEQPAAGQTDSQAIPSGRPLTRRELRALEVARAAAAAPGPAVAEERPPLSPSLAPEQPVFQQPVFEQPVFEQPVVEQPDELPNAEHWAPTGSAFTLPAPDEATSTPIGAMPLSAMPAPSAGDAATGSVPVAPLYDLSPPPTQAPVSPLPFLPPSMPADAAAEAPAAPLPPAPHFSLADLPAPQAQPFADLPAAPPSLADLRAPDAPLDAQLPPRPEASEAPQFSLAQYPAPTIPPQPATGSDRGVDLAPQFFTAPLGHWTTQEAIDDVNQAVPSAPARDVSTGPITSNALVMPAVPSGSDLSVPFSTTGEVLITGSISLPSSMGSTGAHPTRYDHSDLDAIIDAVDRDDAEGDSAPVRAIRAVSTHTSPRDIISQTTRSSGSKLPVVLVISAGAMMVSVTVLIVAGFMTGTF